jgi:hypothetical protein
MLSINQTFFPGVQHSIYGREVTIIKRYRTRPKASDSFFVRLKRGHEIIPRLEANTGTVYLRLRLKVEYRDKQHCYAVCISSKYCWESVIKIAGSFQGKFFLLSESHFFL